LPPGFVTINELGEESDDTRPWWKKMREPYGDGSLPPGFVTINELGEESDDTRPWWKKMREPYEPPDEGDSRVAGSSS